jgi:hypothetical protein
VVTYALPQQHANLLLEHIVGENTPIRLKLMSVSPAAWPISVAHLDSAVAPALDVTQTELSSVFTRGPPPDQENGIFEDRRLRGGRATVT